MVFLPRTWIEGHPAPRFTSHHAHILQIVLLFLLVGGWAVVSDEWIAATGVRSFATFAFLILMALLFYVLGRAYGAAQKELMYVYMVPSLFFVTAVFLFFATTAGALRLEELMTGDPLTSSVGPSIFLGSLALGVFGLSFFQLGTGKLHPTEVILTLFLLAWTALILFYPFSSGFMRLTEVLSPFLLALFVMIGYFRRENWFMAYALFFTSLLIGVKFLE
jgi:hypothetical protein